MRVRLLRISNGGSVKLLGARLVLMVFLVTFLSSLPSGQLPTLLDLYHGMLSAAIAALVLLEKSDSSPPMRDGTKVIER